jgi:hypothetical protein
LKEFPKKHRENKRRKNMIEGFKLKITSSELRYHCGARAEYHRSRAKQKTDELPKVKEAMEAIK